MNFFEAISRVAVPKPYEGFEATVDLTWLPQLDLQPTDGVIVPMDGCVKLLCVLADSDIPAKRESPLSLTFRTQTPRERQPHVKRKTWQRTSVAP